jgi:AraC-like DNA-binding protein
MQSKKRQLPSSYKTFKIKNTINSKLMPFYLNNLSYNTDKKLSLGTEYKISEIFILYSINGIVEFFDDTDVYYLYPNDLILSTCSSLLRFNSVGNKKWDYIYIIIDGSHAKLLYNLIRTKNKILRINPFSSVLDNLMDLLKLDGEMTTRNSILISNIISNLLTELYEESFEIIKSKNQLPASDNDIKNIMKYISKNYEKDLTIDIICNEICFSKFYFCKIFKEQTGISIHKYINEFRINKSKDLLTYSKLSISAIARSVGFKNELTYIRSFKSCLNMTPTEYRKNF